MSKNISHWLKDGRPGYTKKMKREKCYLLLLATVTKALSPVSFGGKQMGSEIHWTGSTMPLSVQNWSHAVVATFSGLSVRMVNLGYFCPDRY